MFESALRNAKCYQRIRFGKCTMCESALQSAKCYQRIHFGKCAMCKSALRNPQCANPLCEMQNGKATFTATIVYACVCTYTVRSDVCAVMCSFWRSKIVFGDTSSLLKCLLLEYPVQSSSTVIHIHVQRQTAYPLYKHIW